MVGLKLGRLPDRTPVKLTIAISPDLKRALDDYADYLNGQPVSLEIRHRGSRGFLRNSRAFWRGRTGISRPVSAAGAGGDA